MFREGRMTAETGKWGWKAPHSIYYLPFFDYYFSGRFRFIHVIRDGRDIALGDNQNQYKGACSKADSVGGECDSSISSRLLYWAVMNMEVFDYGINVLGPDKYFPVRTEDYALKPDATETLIDMLDFLGEQRPEPAVRKVAEGCHGHEKSYGGKKFTPEQRQQYLREFGKVGAEALDFFGYRQDDWGLTEGRPPFQTMLQAKRLRRD